MRRDEATPDEWKLIGGNRIAVFRNGKTIRIAEFYDLYDGENLPAAENAALAVKAVTELRAKARPPGWGNQ